MNFKYLLPTPLDFLKRYFQQSASFVDTSLSPPFPSMLYIHQKINWESFFTPKYNMVAFSRAVSVLDQAVMDKESMEYPASILAASVFLRAMTYWVIDTCQTIKLTPRCREIDCQTHKNCKYEQVLLVCTGYSSDALGKCCTFLEHYTPIDLDATLDHPYWIDCIQSWAMDNKPLRLEEHQFNNDIDVSFYGNHC